MLIATIFLRDFSTRPGAIMLFARAIVGNVAGDGREAYKVLAANGVTLPLGCLLLRTEKAQTAGASVTCAFACAGNLVGDGRDACEVLAANGAMLPLGRLLLRAGKTQSAGASQAAVCAAWALSNTLFSSPSEVGCHSAPY